MNGIVLVLTTLPATFDAAELGGELVAAGLAACVNILPGVRSVYAWQGATHVDAEQQLLIKTTEGRIDELRAALATRHPYELPEFVVLPVAGGSPAYLQWVADSVRPQG